MKDDVGQILITWLLCDKVLWKTKYRTEWCSLPESYSCS